MSPKLNDFSVGLLVQMCLTVNELDSAADLVDAMLRKRPQDAACHAVRAFLWHRGGDARAADESMGRARAIDAADPLVCYIAGRIAAQKGDTDEAVRQFSRTIEGLPWFRPPFGLLDKLLFPGPDYMDLLEQIHALLRPRVYLEIGVNRGKSLALSAAAELAVGVDPNLSSCSRSSVSHARLVEAKSDEFFARADLHAVLEGRPVDLGFIDGMHLFEYGLRDFINMERMCRAGSVILIHDVVPCVPVVGARQRTTRTWTGDVWKVLLCLARHRPDLDLTLVMTSPSGLAIVRNLDPSNRVLADKLPSILDEYTAMTCPGYNYAADTGIRVIPSGHAGLASPLKPVVEARAR